MSGLAILQDKNGITYRRIRCFEGHIDFYHGYDNPNYGRIDPHVNNNMSWFRLDNQWHCPNNQYYFKQAIDALRDEFSAKEIWDSFIELREL